MPIPVSALERLKKNSVGKIIYIRKVIRDYGSGMDSSKRIL